ncbi:hypothetical protein niasHS_002349 [Heterodera schachtii]|uniref:PH domain-containing protein n=1 Tax=Heterodera schachtii TaxID=97005 RepID=A0ABD2KK68_HETSC
MGICRWLGRKEEVSLFDNGLRIESSLKILTDDKWQNRYVVCQRRCLSEAPLLGIFKNGGNRERGEHLELFYLQNYIGYEYGFKFKRSNKTLAILIQGQTLIFSFSNVESMVFWKEWLKDVCGRSAMYFVKCHTIPKDNSVIKLNSRSARIHITRYALVIVQEVPPKQRLYLNLEDLSDVECVQNRFAFRALTYPWSTPQSFVFTSDQIPELTAKLQCLLKTKQYLHQGSQASRMPSLKSSSLGQASSSHQQLLFSPSPLYANEGRQTPSPIFASLYANEGRRPHSQSSDEGEAEPPPLKKKSIEEGPYAIPVDLGSERGGELSVEDLLRESDPAQSKEDAQDRAFEDLQFIEGTPAQFLNQQLVSEVTHFSPNAAPPGLVKPTSDSPFLTFAENGHHKIGKSLSRKLKRRLTGSYTKYDGDKSNSISYTRESNESANCGALLPTKSVISMADKAISKQSVGNELVNCRRKDEPFVTSSIRIDSAIQRGSERLKWSQRSSTSNSQRESSVEREEHRSHSEESSLCENAVVILTTQRGIDEANVMVEEENVHLLKSEEEMSMSTATFGGTSQRKGAMNESAMAEENITYSGSFATTVHYVNTPLANSLNELLETTVSEKGNSSAMSLQEKNLPLYASCEKFVEADATSLRSLSICSELNARIIQRGGRTRVSGRSNKDKMIRRPSPPSLPPPLPPRKQSSQPCFSKYIPPVFDGDYVDIDAIMEINQSEYINKSMLISSNAGREMPKYQSHNATDYIQVYPNATPELRKTDESLRAPMRRSSSLYDFFVSQQPPVHSLAKKNNEAKYYARNWELFPRSFVSSSSHMICRPKGKEKYDILPN